MSDVVPGAVKGGPAGRSDPPAALVAVVLAAVAVTAAFALPRYPDSPPIGHTGGFGEPTCTVCHFEGDPNDPAGKLELTGVPAEYTPGATYTLTITLTRPGLAAGGFQLAARYATGAAAGKPAGVLTPGDSRVRVTKNETTGVGYAHHVAAGIVPERPGSIQWQVQWQAPEEPGTVVFHVAANAADGDQSPFGDWIYTTSVETRSASADSSASASAAGSERPIVTSGVACQAATSRSAPAMSSTRASDTRTACSR
jgi:hypothetical protein